MLQEILDKVFGGNKSAAKVAEDARVTQERDRRLATVVSPNKAVIDEIHALERRAARRD